MSFRIFAAGSEKFNYVKDRCIEQSDFEPIKVAEILRSMELSKTGAAGAVIDHQAKGIADLAGAVANRVFLHNLSTAVGILAMCDGAGEGWISVSARETSVLWPDTVRFSKYDFSPGDSPGAEFIAKIGPSLKDTDLNDWGVLCMLSIVISSYSVHIGGTGRPMLNIQLTK